jgi:hypothetical protein
MDISGAEYRGIPLAYRSPHGDVHPSDHDTVGRGWVSSWPGGLMTGCGMTTAGAGSVDAGETLGLHGFLSHIPASDVDVEESWSGEECLFRISGTVREQHADGTFLTLRRSIETRLGSASLAIVDEVVNNGSGRAPLMLLYHINLGWPLLDEGAFLAVRSRGTTPRDADAAAGLTQARRYTLPVAGFREQVFYHDLEEDADGFSSAALVNPRLALGVTVRFRRRELPRFTEWKMMAQGTYVVGLEPANCGVEGRAHERSRGTLHFLNPGERRSFRVEIGVLDGAEALSAFLKDYSLA